MPVLNVGAKRILYIHVPKTGGTSVEALLRSYGPVQAVRVGTHFDGLPCSPQHFHAPLLEHVYSTDPHRAAHTFDYVFMTVRHPLERLASEYRYAARQARGSRRKRLTFPRTFAGWVRRSFAAYRRNPFTRDNHIRPQHEFRAFDAEAFRLEDGLERIVAALDAVTGVTGTLPRERLNDTVSNPRKVALPPSLLRVIAEFYTEDYRLFGYDGDPLD